MRDEAIPFGNKHITVLIEDTTCNQALPMVHTEWNFTHEAVPLHTERLQKSYSTQNESASTIEQISIVEHEYQLDETSWFDKKVQTITSKSMLHDIIIVQTNVSKSSETKSFPSEPKAVPTFILRKRLEQLVIGSE